MNTVKSFWIGWGSLCIAGGGAYYFAKKSINADKIARFEADQRRRRYQESLEHSGQQPNNGKPDSARNPSQDAPSDPTATGHDPVTEEQRVNEKSKYETTQPFRSRKGDRFS